MKKTLPVLVAVPLWNNAEDEKELGNVKKSDEVERETEPVVVTVLTPVEVQLSVPAVLVNTRSVPEKKLVRRPSAALVDVNCTDTELTVCSDD